MQLLDPAQPPSPASKAAEKAKVVAPKIAAALPQARERFIPVSRYGLRAKLIAMLAESERDRKVWGRALDCLAAWRHQEHRKCLLDLIEDYLPFSPDSDTASLIELDRCGRDKARAEFIDGIERMLARANFVRLSRDDVQRLLVEQSPYGLNLKVDLSEFDEALLYYRGTGTIVREERNPWRLYLRKDRLEVPIFERLFLLLKLKPAETVTRFLAERCGVNVNFDAEDALKRLRADGLVSADADGKFSAIAPEAARAHLDRLWDRLLDVDSLDRQAPSAGA